MYLINILDDVLHVLLLLLSQQLVTDSVSTLTLIAMSLLRNHNLLGCVTNLDAILLLRRDL